MKKQHIASTVLTIAALALTACGKKPTEEPAAASNAAPAAPASGVPLTTELPPELIEGTPQPMDVPNLVQALVKAPELLVPEGTTLLSAGKPVTSSEEYPMIGDLTYVTDGDKQAGEGYYVELSGGTQWVQIDLEKSAEVSAVWTWHFHSQKRAYHDVIIQVSDDAEFKTGVTTIYNNDYDDSSKLGKGSDNPYVESRFGLLVDAKGAKGRYVRLFSQGNTSNESNHYIEVEVFGKVL
jgi:predicted small lipoprotein YifL